MMCLKRHATKYMKILRCTCITDLDTKWRRVMHTHRPHFPRKSEPWATGLGGSNLSGHNGTETKVPAKSSSPQPNRYIDWPINISSCSISDYRRGFVMDIIFIDHLEVVTTNRYNTIADFHTLRVITRYR
jgi:hypothetical protein